MRIFHAILPGSLPRAIIKRRGNILSPSSMQAFRAGQTCPVFLFSLLYWLATGQASQHSREHILSSLPSSRKDQPTCETTFTFLHRLFFTNSLSHILSSPLRPMRRPHLIYGPLVSGKSFFHHSSCLLNQRILRETNWIFFDSCSEFSILIPALTTASQLLL